MTNTVRVALTVTNIDRTLKPMEKALTAQLKDIIKAEAREVREDRRKSQVAEAQAMAANAPSKEVSDEEASQSTGQEATTHPVQEER